MIDRQEILEFAAGVGLEPNVVEKDYVLGWMLAGMLQRITRPDTTDGTRGTANGRIFLQACVTKNWRRQPRCFMVSCRRPAVLRLALP